MNMDPILRTIKGLSEKLSDMQHDAEAEAQSVNLAKRLNEARSALDRIKYLYSEQRLQGSLARQEESHLAAIIESSSDAIKSQSLDGIILTWNRGAERLYGYSWEEVIGGSARILITSEQAGEQAELINRIKAGERVEDFETMRLHREGHSLDVSLTVSP